MQRAPWVALAAVMTLLAGCGDDDDGMGPSGPVARVAFAVQPADATAGAAITPAVRIQLQDSRGRVVTTAANPVTISLSANPAGGTLSGTTTVSAVNGVASFADLSIDIAGAGYALEATVDSLSEVSSPFSVVPASPAQLVIVSQPTTTAIGTPIAPAVQVALHDAFGNRVTSATVDVSVALGSNPGTMILHASGVTAGDRFFQLVDPITFTLLPPLPNSQSGEVSGMVYDPGSGDVLGIIELTLLSRIDPNTGLETPVANLDVPELRALAFEAGPGRLLTVGPFSDELFELDASTATTTLLGQVTLAGDSIIGMNGLATDPSDGGVYAVAQLRGNANRRVRNLIRIDVGALTATIIGTLSEDGVAGLTFLPNGDLIAVTGDGATNPESLWSADKTTAAMTLIVAMGLGDDGEAIASVPARLGGSLTVAANSGIASFDDLQVDAPGDGYTLVFTATGLQSTTSAPFNVTP